MFLGLFNLRGEIVPLIDTAALLGLGLGPPVAFAVVLHTHLGPVGLSGSAFPQRTLMDDPLGASELPGSAGRYRVGRQVAVLLDIEALLDSAVGTALQPVGLG
jgi:purine-binding chemotaxis protein CheW